MEMLSSRTMKVFLKFNFFSITKVQSMRYLALKMLLCGEGVSNYGAMLHSSLQRISF